MATLTIRMPDEKAQRLKVLARARGVSVNKLFEEWTTMGIAEFDSQARFMARAARGSRERGLAMLQELDNRDREGCPGGSSYGLHDSADQSYDPGKPKK